MRVNVRSNHSVGRLFLRPLTSLIAYAKSELNSSASKSVHLALCVVTAGLPNSPKYDVRSLWIKPTEALNSNFIGITTLHVSGSLSARHQEFLSVHRASKLHKMYQSRCTAKNSWWRAERLLETCRVVIPIKLEFSGSVGFIHKEFVTLHDHTILKYDVRILRLLLWPSRFISRDRTTNCAVCIPSPTSQFLDTSIRD